MKTLVNLCLANHQFFGKMCVRKSSIDIKIQFVLFGMLHPLDGKISEMNKL